MTPEEIKDNLCEYDPRHPDYAHLAEIMFWAEDNDAPEPRTNCYCDNCFNGRDPLAVELLKTVDS